MTILNQTEIMQTSLWVLIVFIIFMVLGTSLVIVGFIANKEKIIPISLPVFFLAIFIRALGSAYKVPTGRYRYECTIDSKTSISEINENYKIVEQRGDLWVLEDKDEH